jgi:Xaa-Pro aminopeptidase
MKEGAMEKKGFSKVSFDWEHRKKWLDVPFPTEEYENRIARLRKAMNEAGLEALLIYGGPGYQAQSGDVRYISNFPSMIGNTIVVIPAEGDPMLTTDSVFHSEPMHSEIFKCWIKDVRPAHLPGTVRSPENIARHVRDFLQERGLDDKRAGLVGERFFPAYLLNDLKKELPRLTLDSAVSLYMKVKSVKSPREMEIMKKACRITSLGLEAAMNLGRPGVTELEMSAAAHQAMVAGGAEVVTFVAMVGGPRAGYKTVMPSERKLEDGDMVFMDMGVNYEGYNTDCCRSMVVGRAGSKQKNLLKVALEMEESVIAAVKPGVRICDLQKIAKDIAEKAGYGEYYFPTGFGHGIGTCIVEMPLLFEGNEAPVEEGNTFALEPMIVVEGLGTGCFEDIIAVTKTGGVDLSTARKRSW